jgi:hypothetical protein
MLDFLVRMSRSRGVPIEGQGTNVAWNLLLAVLGRIGELGLSDGGDMSGKAVRIESATVAKLTAHDVSIAASLLNIGAQSGRCAVLRLAAAYRPVNQSVAIRRGRAQARMAGHRIGRPPMPTCDAQRILDVTTACAGTRGESRRLRVNPDTAIEIRRIIAVNSDLLSD